MDQLQFGKQTIFISSSERMDELDDGIIDVIITSPPYNVGKTYSANGAKYNDKKDYREYLDMLTRVFKECYRVASRKCVFFLNIGDSAKSQGKSEDVARCAVDAGFTRLQTIIWMKSAFGKGHYTPSGGNRRLNNLWEFIFILVKTREYEINPKKIGIPYSDKSNIGRYSDIDLRDAGDVWFIPYSKTTGHTIKKGHDAPYPLELPYKCLQLVEHPRTVLDPFVGTASTLRAAEELGLRGFGYEILPRTEVIEARMREPIADLHSPLLPQLEFQNDFLVKFVDMMLQTTSRATIDRILDKFKKRDKRRFRWSCQDLKTTSILLRHINNESGKVHEGKKNRGKEPDSKKDLFSY
ncbi:MAG: DNA-methyltransferase [Promethearchaeota archaeon]